MSDGPPGYTVMLVPDSGAGSRSWHLSRLQIRMGQALLALVALSLVAMVATWAWVARRATLVPGLRADIVALEEEVQRVDRLAARLEEVEARYRQVRNMLGPSGERPSDVWLPPAAGATVSPATAEQDDQSLPTTWPLTERGFVTQQLIEGVGGEHPGLDIAIPTDSYIRAAGAGTVVDVGEGPVYGRFVVIDHGDGYSSLYGHASTTLVQRGQRVRRAEVIGLSGSTGRSTAPHLHFEILLNGEAVDPLSMVAQP